MSALLKPGDRVATRWFSDEFEFGTVLSLIGDCVRMRQDDGDFTALRSCVFLVRDIADVPRGDGKGVWDRAARRECWCGHARKDHDDSEGRSCLIGFFALEYRCPCTRFLPSWLQCGKCDHLGPMFRDRCNATVWRDDGTTHRCGCECGAAWPRTKGQRR